MLSVDLIIKTLCPKDEDYDYPCIVPSYLEEELERIVSEQEREEKQKDPLDGIER